ncbi:hypothetical protein G647_10237 [Cladophialophora carrionii CBS 160.54]|uniref:Uncharacterized protein n=1 Tax=Cladophialophora carrionii CBS 160.54 TaxID=1279043 RepID=V9DLH1_9EURO|nr:uncharacterized protein G647_10237 [Cladophialophora carrionii CBS 160.54]ETI26792.1 hypothetical protein G647_10237 [Cladophialophora carrionii CBS 160.54]
MIERDRRLEKALLQADDELLYSVVALRSYRFGEQHFIGDAVLYMEELMEEAVHLLVEARPYERKYQGTWSLLNASATGLTDRIYYWGFSVMSQMRQMLYEKAYSKHSPQRTSSTWGAWLRNWICVSTMIMAAWNGRVIPHSRPCRPNPEPRDVTLSGKLQQAFCDRRVKSISQRRHHSSLSPAHISSPQFLILRRPSQVGQGFFPTEDETQHPTRNHTLAW